MRKAGYKPDPATSGGAKGRPSSLAVSLACLGGGEQSAGGEYHGVDIWQGPVGNTGTITPRTIEQILRIT